MNVDMKLERNIARQGRLDAALSKATARLDGATGAEKKAFGKRINELTKEAALCKATREVFRLSGGVDSEDSGTVVSVPTGSMLAEGQ